MTTNFNISARERLMSVIQGNSKYPITASDVVIGTPVAVTENGRNTKLIITAASGSRFIYKRTLFYNRLSLQELFGSGVQPEIATDTPVTSHDLIPYISDQLHLALLPEDIVLEPLTTGTYILRAAATSLGWIDDVTIKFIAVAPISGFALDDSAQFTLDDGSVFLLDDDGAVPLI